MHILVLGCATLGAGTLATQSVYEQTLGAELKFKRFLKVSCPPTRQIHSVSNIFFSNQNFFWFYQVF